MSDPFLDVEAQWGAAVDADAYDLVVSVGELLPAAVALATVAGAATARIAAAPGAVPASLPATVGAARVRTVPTLDVAADRSRHITAGGVEITSDVPVVAWLRLGDRSSRGNRGDPTAYRAGSSEGVVDGAELAEVAMQHLDTPRRFVGDEAKVVGDLDELRWWSVLTPDHDVDLGALVAERQELARPFSVLEQAGGERAGQQVRRPRKTRGYLRPAAVEGHRLGARLDLPGTIGRDVATHRIPRGRCRHRCTR